MERAKSARRVMSVRATGTFTIIGLSDGVVLVVRAGHTMREAALVASQRLSEDGTRILGTVLNSWDPRKTPGRTYGYGYGYGQSAEAKASHPPH